MNKYAVAVIVGLVIFAAGWAIRSTVVMHSYANKPVGGALIVLGFLILGGSIYLITKNR